MHRYLQRKTDSFHRSPSQKVSTIVLHPRPVLSHCPLSCLTLELHEFLMADMVTVGIVYWPRCAIFSAQLSRRGGEVAAGRNMTLMCQSQRPRLAQRLSILRRDQQFFSKTARSLPTRNHCGGESPPPVQEAQDKPRRDAIGPVSISLFLRDDGSSNSNNELITAVKR